MAGSMKRPVRRKALRDRAAKAASVWPARACLMGFSALTKPDRMAKAATLARPMKRHRMKGSWNTVGGRLGPSAGVSRMGDSERATCAVTTSRDAIPRRPYEPQISTRAAGGVLRLSHRPTWCHGRSRGSGSAP
jgi:hypothetical protein